MNESNLETAVPFELSLSLVRYAAETVLGDHSHARASDSLVLGGGFEEGVGRVEMRAGIGDVVVKPPGIVHRNRFGPAGAMLISIADIPGALFRGPGWRRFEGGRLVRRATQAAAALRGGDPHGIAQEAMWEVLAAAGAVAPAPAETGVPHWLSRLRDEVAGAASRPSVTALARQAGVHPVYLTRLFRKCYGRSISGFLRKLRAERAADLLGRTDLSVGAIAAELGFADQSHLCRTFRAELGLAPSAYRAIMRG